MRNSTIVFLLISLISFNTLQAKPVNSGISDDEPGAVCIPLSTEEAEASDVIQQILDVVGLCPNFEVKSADIRNASAKIMDKKRYIMFNPEFIKSIKSTAKTDWAAMSILAHEIGHHLNGHTITSGGSKPPLELEADEFSGFVMRKLGASLEEAQAAVNLISSEKGSKSHPPRHLRLKAVEKGWKKADKQSSTVVSSKKERSLLPEKYILKEISFYSLKDGKFFITNNLNVVTIDEKGLFVIGKFLTDSDKSYLLLKGKNGMVKKYSVELDGTIRSATNKAIGELVG